MDGRRAGEQGRHRGQELVEVERLGEEGGGRRRRHPAQPLPRRAHQDDRRGQVRVVVHVGDQDRAVEMGQHVVGHQQVEAAALDRLQPGDAVADEEDAVPLIL